MLHALGLLRTCPLWHACVPWMTRQGSSLGYVASSPNTRVAAFPRCRATPPEVGRRWRVFAAERPSRPGGQSARSGFFPRTGRNPRSGLTGFRVRPRSRRPNPARKGSTRRRTFDPRCGRILPGGRERTPPVTPGLCSFPPPPAPEAMTVERPGRASATEWDRRRGGGSARAATGFLVRPAGRDRRTTRTTNPSRPPRWRCRRVRGPAHCGPRSRRNRSSTR